MTERNKKQNNGVQGDLESIEDEIIGDRIRELFAKKNE
jgi:hypothetical protein